MDSLRIKFGRAVREVRAKHGYSQESFAMKAGINRSYMGRIERGEVNISLDNIGKIARALGLSVAKLMVEVDK